MHGASHVPGAMSAVVDVGLISGKTVSLEAQLDEPVATLKRHAQTALTVGKGRLLDASGLGGCWMMSRPQRRKLETWTSLTLQLKWVQIQAS